jgi:hypothetical protein
MEAQRSVNDIPNPAPYHSGISYAWADFEPAEGHAGPTWSELIVFDTVHTGSYSRLKIQVMAFVNRHRYMLLHQQNALHTSVDSDCEVVIICKDSSDANALVEFWQTVNVMRSRGCTDHFGVYYSFTAKEGTEVPVGVGGFPSMSRSVQPWESCQRRKFLDMRSSVMIQSKLLHCRYGLIKQCWKSLSELELNCCLPFRRNHAIKTCLLHSH